MKPKKSETPTKVEFQTNSKTPPETVQTGQRQPWFEMAQDEEGLWQWCLWSGNGRQMANSAIGYNQSSECKDAIKTFNGTLGAPLRIAVAST